MEKLYPFRLRSERERLGLTQAEVAKQLHVALKTVKNWEREDERNTPIQADKLVLLAALGVDVQYILTGVRSVNVDQVVAGQSEKTDKNARSAGAISREDQVWLELLHAAPPDERARIRAVLDALLSGRNLDRSTGNDG